jgi:hypothetical protein
MPDQNCQQNVNSYRELAIPGAVVQGSRVSIWYLLRKGVTDDITTAASRRPE